MHACISVSQKLRAENEHAHGFCACTHMQIGRQLGAAQLNGENGGDTRVSSGDDSRPLRVGKR